MILLVLIFFTSLGTVVATSDNDLSHISSEISDDLKSPNLEENLKIDDLNENQISSDDSEGVDQSSNALDNSLSNNDYSKNKDILSSTLTTGNPSKNNDIILIKSQSPSLLSSPQTIVIEDASYYDGSINEYIQKLIVDAEAGSTIQFAGSSYENIYLKISKPLNIISKSGTKINNIFNVPAFTILEGGSGTNISGFTINSSGSFVEASDVSGITISGNKISTKRSGIVLNEVYDSFIKSNIFSNFKIAIDISESGGIVISKNRITPVNANNIGINLKEISSKKGISILNNNITASDRRKEATAIYFGRNACNILVKQNIIRKWYTAIDLPYSINNVSMINNTITDNGDGLIINGWINNFTFNKNLVTGNGRVGVLFDDNFFGTKGNLTLENNFFSRNGVMDLQNKGDQAVSIGKNFAKRKCYRVGMKYGLKIRTRQSGSKYYFSVVDKYGYGVSGLPNFSATLTVGDKSYNVNFIDSVGFLDTGSGAGKGSSSNSYLDVGEDSRKFSDWGQYEEIDSEDMEYYEDFYKELLKSIMDSTNSNSNQNSSENGSSSSSSHSGSGDSGSSSGSNSINSNGILSGSAGASSSVSSSSASSSPSQSSNVPESASAKTLSVDEETFRVIGVGGLILLIVLVIGAYYREDIKRMMEE